MEKTVCKTHCLVSFRLSKPPLCLVGVKSGILRQFSLSFNPADPTDTLRSSCSATSSNSDPPSVKRRLEFALIQLLYQSPTEVPDNCDHQLEVESPNGYHSDRNLTARSQLRISTSQLLGLSSVFPLMISLIFRRLYSINLIHRMPCF